MLSEDTLLKIVAAKDFPISDPSCGLLCGFSVPLRDPKQLNFFVITFGCFIGKEALNNFPTSMWIGNECRYTLSY